MKFNEFNLAVDGMTFEGVQMPEGEKVFARISGFELLSKNDNKVDVGCCEFYEFDGDMSELKCYLVDVI